MFIDFLGEDGTDVHAREESSDPAAVSLYTNNGDDDEMCVVEVLDDMTADVDSVEVLDDMTADVDSADDEDPIADMLKKENTAEMPQLTAQDIAENISVNSDMNQVQDTPLSNDLANFVLERRPATMQETSPIQGSSTDTVQCTSSDSAECQETAPHGDSQMDVMQNLQSKAVQMEQGQSLDSLTEEWLNNTVEEHFEMQKKSVSDDSNVEDESASSSSVSVVEQDMDKKILKPDSLGEPMVCSDQ